MAADVIRAEGGKVDTAITVVDRQEGAREKLKAAGIKLIALLEASEFDLEARGQGAWPSARAAAEHNFLLNN